MNNRMLYRRAFSRLHASDALELEEMKMKKTGTNIRCRRSLLVFTVMLTFLMAMSAIAYAATGGQIIEKMKVFIGGQEVDSVVVKSEDGNEYRIQVDEDAEGNVVFDYKENDGSPADLELDGPANFDIVEKE